MTTAIYDGVAMPGASMPAIRRERANVRQRATYDAAQTTNENKNHWSAADSLSANAANTPTVRQTLRNRARYEYANNSYCRGMLLTLANDVVGTGPRLQVLEDGLDADAIEREFNAWATEIRLAEKLRTARISQARDGESFLMFRENGALRSPVKLDVRLIEADQVSSGVYTYLRGFDKATDGIVYDDWGNPLAYHILRHHPGDLAFEPVQEPETVQARFVVHLYRVERAGQSRGVPEITPALPLFAQLRRYTLAVIAAAETAADVAGVIKSTNPAGDPDELEPLDAIDIERRTWMTLPEGWDISQIRAEQPTTTYGDFKAQILNEIARCLNMPFNVATANSSGYNYASGRMDHQVYHKHIDVDRYDIDCRLLNPLFDQWCMFARQVDGYLALGTKPILREWQWDGREHVDPAKAANAQQVRLANHVTTLAAEYAAQGKDWEKELRQRARELKLMEELGLSLAQTSPQSSQSDGRDDDDQ